MKNYQLFMKFGIGVMLMAAMIGCSNDNANSSEVASDTSTLTDQTPKTVVLTAAVDNLRIRDKAGLEGEEVAKVTEGATLTFQGGFSDFNDKIKLREDDFNELWLSVKTDDGKEGWVYGGAVTFDTLANADFYRQMSNKKVLNLYGTDALKVVKDYQSDFDNIKTEAEFQEFYANMIDQLRIIDSIVFKDVEFESNEYGDMFYAEHFGLAEALPGGDMIYVAEGTEYDYTRYFPALIRKAKTTEGTADDEFLELMVMANDYEIEYFFKSWFVQTWDYGGYSLLGKGIHTKVLDKMDACLANSTLFADQINELKNYLVNDILDAEGYGLSQSKVVAEVSNIIKKDYAVFTADEKAKLKKRLEVLKKGDDISFDMEQ